VAVAAGATGAAGVAVAAAGGEKVMRRTASPTAFSTRSSYSPMKPGRRAWVRLRSSMRTPSR
jgi:hypothetical protein